MELKVRKSTKQYRDYDITTGRIVIGTVNKSSFGRGSDYWYTIIDNGMIEGAELYKLSLTAATLNEMRRKLKEIGDELDFCTEGCGKITEHGICMSCGIEIERQRAERKVKPTRAEFDGDYSILADYHSDDLSFTKGFTILDTESENRYMVLVKNVTRTANNGSDNYVNLNLDDLEAMVYELKSRLAASKAQEEHDAMLEKNLQHDERGESRECECGCGIPTPTARYYTNECRARVKSRDGLRLTVR